MSASATSGQQAFGSPFTMTHSRDLGCPNRRCGTIKNSNDLLTPQGLEQQREKVEFLELTKRGHLEALGHGGTPGVLWVIRGCALRNEQDP